MAKYLQVALNVPLNQTFTYLNIEPSGISRIGCRVEIKFGARKTKGCEFENLPTDFPIEESKIRPITKVIDEKPLLTPELIELAFWVSKYYICAIGEAVSAMLPSAKRETDAGGFSFVDEISSEKAAVLSEEQEKAVKEILSPESKTNLHYLYGPTGTGKTEVFLQCAQKILDQKKRRNLPCTGNRPYTASYRGSRKKIRSDGGRSSFRPNSKPKIKRIPQNLKPGGKGRNRRAKRSLCSSSRPRPYNNRRRARRLLQIRLNSALPCKTGCNVPLQKTENSSCNGFGDTER